MISVAEAWQAILGEVIPFPAEPIPLADAWGLVLAREVVSDIDSPPFDKALMDGYAVRIDDLADYAALSVIEEVTAGVLPTRCVEQGEATRIMTGAPMPAGADTVIPVEQTALDETAGRVTINATSVAPKQHVLHQGCLLRRGNVVLKGGTLLRAQELGALAEMGQAEVSVRRRPRVAILATGDELGTVDAIPGPGQIRNSNEWLLSGQVEQAGGIPQPLGIARDNRAELSEKVRQGLAADILLLSGGVSAGKLDLVPSVLDELGVGQVFHKVHIKPGKPIWFGVYERPVAGESDGNSGAISPASPSSGGKCYVFGLPGNPVGSMVCFELFVRAAIRRLVGISPAEPQSLSACLQVDHFQRGDRPTYFPSRLWWTADGACVTPINWRGSADIQSTVEANAMTLFTGTNVEYKAGRQVEVFPWTTNGLFGTGPFGV